MYSTPSHRLGAGAAAVPSSLCGRGWCTTWHGQVAAVPQQRRLGGHVQRLPVLQVPALVAQHGQRLVVFQAGVLACAACGPAASRRGRPAGRRPGRRPRTAAGRAAAAARSARVWSARAASISLKPRRCRGSRRPPGGMISDSHHTAPNPSDSMPSSCTRAGWSARAVTGISWKPSVSKNSRRRRTTRLWMARRRASGRGRPGASNMAAAGNAGPGTGLSTVIMAGLLLTLADVS